MQAIKDGNASFLPAQFEWEVADLTAPVVTIDSGPSGTVDATTATFVFSANEPATFECSLDGAPFGVCQSGIQYTGLGLGQHTFDVRATDLSEGENVEREPVSRTWTVADLHGAELTLSQTAGRRSTTGTTATFTFSAHRQLAARRAHVRVPPRTAAAFAACTSPDAYSGLSPGQHTLRGAATDAAGNVARRRATPGRCRTSSTRRRRSRASRAGSLIFDVHAAPTTTRAAERPDVPVPPRRRRVRRLHEPEDVLRRRPRSDDAGQHTFQVRAIDEAGNVDATPASHTLTVPTRRRRTRRITGQPDGDDHEHDARPSRSPAATTAPRRPA